MVIFTLPLLSGSLQAAGAELKPFSAAAHGDWFLARTGYTGEHGYEVILPVAALTELWVAVAARSTPCGLGARDTLRLEMGFHRRVKIGFLCHGHRQAQGGRRNNPLLMFPNTLGEPRQRRGQSPPFP